MIIDCGTCTVRGAACRDCVVSVLLESDCGEGSLEVDDTEQRALHSLAHVGLVPLLRHESPPPHRRTG